MTAKTGITIRRAEPGDAAALRALVRESYGKWVPLIGREPKPMGADYAHAIAHHLVYLHEDAGRRLTAALELIREPAYLLVENVAVSPAAQGRGIGRALMAEAELIAWDMGLREMRLYTNEKFEPNIRLYESIGYEIFDREPIGTSVAVWMKKAVTAGY